MFVICYCIHAHRTLRLRPFVDSGSPIWRREFLFCSSTRTGGLGLEGLKSYPIINILLCRLVDSTILFIDPLDCYLQHQTCLLLRIQQPPPLPDVCCLLDERNLLGFDLFADAIGKESISGNTVSVVHSYQFEDNVENFLFLKDGLCIS